MRAQVKRQTSLRDALLALLSLGAIAVLVAFVAAGALPHAAYANTEVTSDIGVSDDITRIHVNKLDADTHEYVEGAAMMIIEKDTGLVVDEWESGKGAHECEKKLDVKKVYILREVSAPNGYTVVEDTEFMANEMEGTGITLLSGGDAELTESYKVNLYDKATDTENVVTVTQTRGTDSNGSGGNSGATKAAAPKTGDETPMSLIATLVGFGIIAIVVLQLTKRRIKE